ncbi:MAG: 2-hydroxyacyl-CoA dehydratase [Candidatus Omnitrophica bacterium]|nr:2-hydroxyacyl-CoA dehydratase [Candidatus Omnitrophota bacterium]
MKTACGSNAGIPKQEGPLAYFQDQVSHGLKYAEFCKERGAKIVGIMCEFTPRELIMAAGGVPVCLCGGSGEMVEPAERVLPSNLCSLIKSTFGYSLEKANPFLEMADLIVAETTCDGKKKMYELLADRHKMHVLELPQKPEDTDAFEHWVAEMNKLKSVLEKQFVTTITDGKLRSAIAVMNRERALKRDLAALMKSSNPPLTGRELLGMKSTVAGMPGDLEQYEQALRMLPGRALNPQANSRVRVLLTGVPLPRGAERVMDIIEDNGGLVVCQENCTGVKPVLDDIDADAPDLIRAIAAKYYHLPCSVMTPNKGRMELLGKLSQEYKAQCVIELVWRTCITYDVESSLVKRLAEDELNLPYLRIETDYSPSDSARIALRVQSLFETVGGRESSMGEAMKERCHG